MMREPPAEPAMSFSSPVCRSSIIIGDMDDSGRLPGSM